MDLQSMSEDRTEDEERILQMLEGPGSAQYRGRTALLMRLLVVARLTVLTAGAATVVTALGAATALHMGLSVLTGTMLMGVALLLHWLSGRLQEAAGAELKLARACSLGAGAIAVVVPWLLLAAGIDGEPMLLATTAAAVPWVLCQVVLAGAHDSVALANDPTAERGLTPVIQWTYASSVVWAPITLALAVMMGLPAWVGAVLVPLPLWIAHGIGTVQIWQTAGLEEATARNMAAPPRAPQSPPLHPADDVADDAGDVPRPPHWPASINSRPDEPPF